MSVEAKVEGSRTFVPLADVKWGVMLHAEVRPASPTPAAGVNLANYMFRVKAPKGTGFQVDRDECVWPPNSWPNTNSGWASASSAIDIVRCGIGDGTKKLEVWLRPRGLHSAFRAYDDLVVGQSWHRADHITSFAFATPLVRNAILLQRNFTMMRGSIKDAAIAWNTASLGYSFGELQSPANPDSADVIVEGLSTQSTSFEDKCAGSGPVKIVDAVACVISSTATYPHLRKESLYFEYPPHTSRGVDYIWTRDDSKVGIQPNGVINLYMPAYITHEFGHTAGLDHNAAASNAMSSPMPPTRAQTLSDDDKKAMKSIYNSHTAH